MKKILKGLLCCILVFTFICTTANVAFAIDETVYMENKLATRKVHNAITYGSSNVNLNKYIPDLVAFKNDILAQLMVDDSNLRDPEGYGYIDLSKYRLPAEVDVYNAVCEFIWYESPELFRVTGFKAELGGKDESLVTGLNSLYIYDKPEDFVRDYNAAVSGADRLLEGIEGNNSLSDVEKALLLHDRIATFCEYDVINLDNDTLPDEAFNMYGVLGKGVAVCMGYALAYDYLLERAGIESQYCSSEKLVHAWNIVYINNKPYHVDITWDDVTNDVSGQVFHDNFLRSTEGIKSTGHTYGVLGRTDYITTPKDTTYDNYFWQDSITSFQYVNDNVYYIDCDLMVEDKTKRKCKLIELDNINDRTHVVIKEITDVWDKVEDGTTWSTGFSKLASGNGLLYYSTKDSVISYDPVTTISEVVITPEQIKSIVNKPYYAIYGLRFDGCTLSGELSDTPDYTLQTKTKYNFKRVRHTEGNEWVEVVSATENTSGKKVRTCEKCDYVYEERAISPLGNHAWSNWFYVKESAPTCTQSGKKFKRCLDVGCNVRKWEYVGALGHSYSNEWTVDTATTCINAGVQSHHCMNCEHTKDITVVRATGIHTPSDWIIGQYPTETVDGYKYKECTVCKEWVDYKVIKRTSSLDTPVVTTGNASKGIKLTWTDVENAESYIVYRRTYNDSTKKYSKWTVLKNGFAGTSYVDTTVKPGVAYSYTVRAVNGKYRSAYKATKGLRYNVTPVVKVANATNGIKVSWTTVANVTGYAVYSSTYNSKTKKWSGWTYRGTTKAATKSWVDKKAKAGVSYKYTVRAVNGSFRGKYKASANVIRLINPTVKVSSVSGGIKINWNKITGATAYKIYRSEYINGKWTSWNLIKTTTDVNSLTYLDSRAGRGSIYRYTVRAVNGGSSSAYVASNSVKA